MRTNPRLLKEFSRAERKIVIDKIKEFGGSVKKAARGFKMDKSDKISPREARILVQEDRRDRFERKKAKALKGSEKENPVKEEIKDGEFMQRGDAGKSPLDRIRADIADNESKPPVSVDPEDRLTQAEVYFRDKDKPSDGETD